MEEAVEETTQESRNEYARNLVWTTFYFDEKTVNTCDVLLTRQFLVDRKLLKKSLATEPVGQDLETVRAKEELEQEMGKTEKTDSDEKLPTSFGSKKTTRPLPRSWLGWIEKMDSKAYWESINEYLIYKEMDEQGQEELLHKAVKSKPAMILPCHEKLKNYADDFVEIGAKYEDPGKRMEALAKFLERRCHQDFLALWASARTTRCRKYLAKMERLGIATGLNKKKFTVPDDTVTPLIDSDDSDDDGEEAAVEPQASSSVETQPIYDVLYEVYEEGAHLEMKLGAKSERPQAQAQPSVEEAATPVYDMANFSFAYDPEKDAQLLASNAYELFHMDKEIRKYWFQRYRLFSRLDQGVLMDREGWFSVTPERIASHIAQRMVTRPGMVIIDGFAGVGGNSIQFALHGAYVIAVDLDPIRLKCAKRNAEVYGVAEHIEFICGDFFHVLSQQRFQSGQSIIDAVFLSPPWGGPSYIFEKEFDIGTGCTPNGFDIFEAARRLTPNIAYFLPRNTKQNQIVHLAGPGGKVEVEQSCLNKKIKTITAYFGNLCQGAAK
ncbi:unnamed protein product, partial [Mesorhabditis spiculigera]